MKNTEVGDYLSLILYNELNDYSWVLPTNDEMDSGLRNELYHIIYVDLQNEFSFDLDNELTDEL